MTRIYTLIEDYSGYESPFLAQHGVSFLIEQNDTTILFDTGQDAAPILSNMETLGIRPQIDYIFLSHCHYDHTGGLLGMLGAIDRKVPIIAHSTIFRSHFIVKPQFKEIGIPFEREKIEKHASLLLTNTPFQIVKDVYSTGEITQREEFEKNILDVYTLKDGNQIKDELSDDMSMVITTSEGLIIVSGCSHAGIISIVNHAIRMTGDSRVRAVIGGFHLVHAQEERIVQTAEAFRNLGVEEVYTGHCTGLRAEALLLKAYERKFHKLHSGLIIEL
jgi:7,8-dihydropterin-6-yl-methyl-4-(beta-D-ribofuranosyl)aminobenzene 5'-phosphate synthase